MFGAYFSSGGGGLAWECLDYLVTWDGSDGISDAGRGPNYNIMIRRGYPWLSKKTYVSSVPLS